MAKTSTKQTSSVLSRGTLRNELVLGALVAEMLGAAVLSFAALMSGNNPVVVAVAVLVLVLVFGELSGGQINPVVTVAAWATKQMTWVKAVGFIVAQIIGAMAAYVIVAKFMKSSDGGAVYTLFDSKGMQQRMPGEWKPIFGEFVGALVFGFGIASAFLYKKVGFDRAFTVGGALLVGLIAALAGSYGVLNPAVAASLSGYAQGGFWSFAAYGLAPLVGGALGALLFKLLKSDADASAKA